MIAAVMPAASKAKPNSAKPTVPAREKPAARSAKKRPSGGSVSLLVPAAALPAEGEDFQALAEGWTGILQALCQGRAPLFHIHEAAVEIAPGIREAGELHWVRLSQSAEDAPRLDAAAATTTVDWSEAIERMASAMSGEHFIASPQERLRVFFEEALSAAKESASGFAGEAVPVFSVSAGKNNSLTAVFCGVWLAEPAEMKAAGMSLPVKGLRDARLSSLGSCLLLNEAEAEGRGLIEAVASLSMLAMVLQQPMQQQTPAASIAAPSARVEAVMPAQGEVQLTEELPVKSQKLKQPAPLVYPNVIRDAEGCEHKVIVDIGGQRAYVFIDNQLAFETPISSASKGRHTPRGTFTITEKIRSGKRSTLYKCLMPYWMRLDQSAIGMHTGQLPGYPASHGCLRMPDESAKFIFDLVPKGTKVHVVDSLKPKAVEAEPIIVAGR